MERRIEKRWPRDENERQIPTAEERLNRLIDMAQPALPKSSPDDSSHDAPKESSVPGVVQVVLKEGVDGRVIAKRLNDPNDHDEHDERLSELRKLLRQHDLVRVQATFFAPRPGRKPEKNPPPGRERYLTFYFATAQTRDISNKLRHTALVERASPAPRIIPPSTPLSESLLASSAAAAGFQWYIRRCNADLAWQLKGPGQFYSGQGVVIADIDWGFLTTHQDIASRIENTFNSIVGGTFVGDGGLTHHGTAVLALAGADVNGMGMVGFAFGADLWAIQADDGSERSSFETWVDAIDYVRTEPSGTRRKVICLEAETADYCNIESVDSVNKAITDAIAAGVVVCVAAGNGNRNAGKDAVGVDITETGSILVGSTLFDPDATINGKNLSSNWGPRVIVSAPGDPRYDWSASSDWDGDYKHFGSTSGATPKVVGAVALMLEANGNLTHAEIRDILNATGTPITGAAGTPIGTFLNVEAAVREALRRAAPAPPPEPTYPDEVTPPQNGNENVVPCGAKHGKIAPSGA